MKKTYLLICSLLLVVTPAFAELTTSDVVSKDYLKNHGYSSSMIEATQRSVSQVNGEDNPKTPDPYKNSFVRGIRKFFMYIDPSYDDHSFMNNHEIHTAPSIDDL